jgi:hypothetical protein
VAQDYLDSAVQQKSEKMGIFRTFFVPLSLHRTRVTRFGRIFAQRAIVYFGQFFYYQVFTLCSFLITMCLLWAVF